MNIEITLLDGTIFETFVDNYDAQVIAESINDPQKLMVAIGDIVLNGRNIRSIVKADTQEPLV